MLVRVLDDLVPDEMDFLPEHEDMDGDPTSPAQDIYYDIGKTPARSPGADNAMLDYDDNFAQFNLAPSGYELPGPDFADDIEQNLGDQAYDADYQELSAFAEAQQFFRDQELNNPEPKDASHRGPGQAELLGSGSAITRFGSAGHRIDTDYIRTFSNPPCQRREYVFSTPTSGVACDEGESPHQFDFGTCSVPIEHAPVSANVFDADNIDWSKVDWSLLTEFCDHVPTTRPVQQTDIEEDTACVAKAFRIKTAIELDEKGVQAAIDKEQDKLLNLKGVYTEDKIMDKSALIQRCRDAQMAGRPDLQMRFSKILLKIFKKGWELPAHMQKWSARACVDGSWITDALTGKQASDQLPSEGLESTPISLEGLRMLIFQSCALGHTLFAGDVTGAYLETKLGQGAPEIWVEVPEQLRKLKSKWARMNCPMVQLIKALYGLPRAGHDWDRYMRSILAKKGWEPLDNMNSIYAKTIRGELCLLGVYVDDMVVSCPDSHVDLVRKELCTGEQSFPIEWNDYEPAKTVKGVTTQNIDLRFLGVHVIINRSGDISNVTFAQTDYAKSIVEVYEDKCKRKCRSAWTPSVKPDDKLAECDKPGKYQKICREILGKLLFLERCSRIDIINAVTTLCGRVSKWTIADDKALDRLMDYVSHTTAMTLQWRIDANDKESMTASLLTDSDWATCKDTSRSVSSFDLTVVGPNTKATIMWGTRKQTFIARSTAEAETGAHVEGLVRALLPALLFIDSLNSYAQTHQLGYTLSWAPTARCDNNAATCALNSLLAGRLSLLAKSSRLNLHWARATLRRCRIKVTRIPTELNCSDLGSKALPQQVHWRLTYTLMTPCKQIHESVSWLQGEQARSGWVPSGTILGDVW